MMKTLAQVLSDITITKTSITNFAEAKAWLQASSPKLLPGFEDRKVTERTIISSRGLGWTRGNEILDALETIAETNTTVARLMRLLKVDAGVDLSDDPTVIAGLKALLVGAGVTLSDDEVNKITALSYMPEPVANYRQYAPGGKMPTDQEITDALA